MPQKNNKIGIFIIDFSAFFLFSTFSGKRFEMTIGDYNKQIVKLIGDDKLKEAIAKLHNLVEGTPLFKEVVIQSARLTDVMKHVRLGTIDFVEEDVRKNRIRSGIFDLLEELETQTDENAAIQKEVTTFLANRPEVNIQNSENVIVNSQITVGRDLNISSKKS